MTRYGPAQVTWVSLYKPIKAVRGADHLGLGSAWAVHAAGMVMLGAVVLVLAIWDLNRGELHPIRLWRKFSEVIQSLWAVMDDPRAWAAVISLVLIVELTWSLSAAVVMSWCAREERYRDSYVRALRRLFLLTPHLTVMTILCGGLYVWMHNSARWRSGFYSGLNTEGALLWLLVFAPVCLWALWAVLRSVGSHPPPAMSRWPLRCGGCGYELAGLDPGGGCPECGHAIAESRSQDTRPGITPAGGFGWWLIQTYRAITSPTDYGKRMHVMSGDPGHRKCLYMTVVMQAMMTPVAIAGLTALAGTIEQLPATRWHQLLPMATIGCILISLAIIATTVSTALLIAGLAGITEGRHLKRNLMPEAVRASGYLSGFAVIWAVVFWCSVALLVIVIQYDLLPAISARYNIAEDKIVIYWHYGLAILGVLLYGVLIERVTRAARYANW